MLLVLALTAVAVSAFFARHRNTESIWRRFIAPAVAAILLTGIVVLAVQHYSTLLGVPTGSIAAWALPGSYGLVAVIGAIWGLMLRFGRPRVFASIGLGPHAVTGQLTPVRSETQP